MFELCEYQPKHQAARGEIHYSNNPAIKIFDWHFLDHIFHQKNYTRT